MPTHHLCLGGAPGVPPWRLEWDDAALTLSDPDDKPIFTGLPLGFGMMQDPYVFVIRHRVRFWSTDRRLAFEPNPSATTELLPLVAPLFAAHVEEFGVWWPADSLRVAFGCIAISVAFAALVAARWTVGIAFGGLVAAAILLIVAAGVSLLSTWRRLRRSREVWRALGDVGALRAKLPASFGHLVPCPRSSLSASRPRAGRFSGGRRGIIGI